MGKTKKRDERLPGWANSWTEVAAKVPTLEYLMSIKQNTVQWNDPTEGHPKHRGIDVLELKALAFDEILTEIQQLNKNEVLYQIQRHRHGAYFDGSDCLSRIFNLIAPLLDE